MINRQHLVGGAGWAPTASISVLKQRASILRTVREFFAARDVLEVETPILCHTSVTDPFIESITAHVSGQPHAQLFYLQTSPEYAMKRLLAAGSGAIYQLSKAFRREQEGKIHNPEFTLLEWYRPGYDHHQLMDEMDDLLQIILKCAPAERLSYQALFQRYFQIDPHAVTLETLGRIAHVHQINLHEDINDKDTWLQLLLSHVIEPALGQQQPCFIYDFPVTQAALARIQPATAKAPARASRFEVYYRGVELANGFHELQDASEQRKRFDHNVAQRKQLGLPLIPIDEFFLAALTHGLPDCAGVALGIDRVVMLETAQSSIADVISFNITNA